MELYTTVEPLRGFPSLSHSHRLMLMGSCFASHIGAKLAEAKFRCDIHPYGVLYNPASIATALSELLEGKRYTPADLYEQRGLWHSPMHHSDFSAPTPDEALERINRRLQQAREALPATDFLLLTWGTAYVYREREGGRIVGNCHQRPERDFVRERLEVDDIVETYNRLLATLWERNPQLQVILTVSPIRHRRDGLHANQLSKSVLLLAADRLCQAYEGRVHYFPAYELLMDELRDYRFYADDLVHPSATAIGWVWERFIQSCFSAETRQVAEECLEIAKALAHKPFRPEGEAYKRFLAQIVLKIERLNEKYPYLVFEKELEICRTR